MINKKIVILGPGGSGKDYLRKRYENKGFKYGVTCTTRPIREMEINGKDYFFVTDEEFARRKENGDFLESCEFRGWKYATPKISWENCDIFIMTLSGYKQLSVQIKNMCFVIYLDIPVKIRRERLINRNDADIVDRRIMKDDEDFLDIDEKIYDLRIKNFDF